MTKRPTTPTGLAKASGPGGQPPGALPAGYATLLADLKARVRAAQLRAALSVNRELILLYWDLGKTIVEAQKTKGYGNSSAAQNATSGNAATESDSPGRTIWYCPASKLRQDSITSSTRFTIHTSRTPEAA